MKNFVRNTLLLGAIFGVSASSAKAADCYSPCQPSCCEWSLCDGKFTVGADYLYWKSQQGNFNTISSFESDGNTYSHQTINHPGFEYESGFRVYGAYELPCDQWQVGAAYTYIPGKASIGSLTIDENAEQLELDYAAFQANWSSTFQYFDLDFARTLKFGECFRLIPHAGFRAAWGDQNLHATGIYDAEGEYDYSHVHHKSKFNGYGVEGGLWAEWTIFCNTSLVGHFGGSVLYTNIHSKGEIIYGVNNSDDSQTDLYTSTIHKKSETAIPSVDYFLGLRYADNFCDWDFSAHIGWESHVWFDLGNIAVYETGNFSTQGLTVGMDVSF